MRVPKRQPRRWFLREWRKFRNLTQEALAERIDATQGLVSQLETYKARYTAELLEKLSEALGCEPADLLIRNPLDKDAPWSIWDTLKPEQKRQAMRLLRALADDEAA